MKILYSQEYKDQIEKLTIEIQNKEEGHKLEIAQLNCNMRKKGKFSEAWMFYSWINHVITCKSCTSVAEMQKIVQLPHGNMTGKQFLLRVQV